MTYRFVDAVPTVEEHGALAISVGWHGDFHWESVPASLAGSLCGVVAYDGDDQPVAMGRVVGDGAFYFYIQDVAVHPDHQRQGLGSQVVRRLRDQIEAMAGADCFVGLFATPDGQTLYAREGFVAENTVGMWQVLRPGKE
jgi:ribosomal protein S18 acetylase RimI-like enzyme